MSFIRYNETNKYYEYDTSGGSGAGPWLILPIDYAQIYNPPVITPPDPIPPNIAFTDVKNQFTRSQNIADVNARIQLKDTSQPIDQNKAEILQINQELWFHWVNDSEGAQTALPLKIIKSSGNIIVSGDIQERNRPVALGQWRDVPFNAANFITISGGGTWTVGAPAVIKNRYTLIGMTMIWQLYISWFSGSNAIGGAPTVIGIEIPGGFHNPGNSILDASYFVDGAIGRLPADASPNSAWLSFNRRDNVPLTNGAAIGIIGTFTFEISGVGVNIDV